MWAPGTQAVCPALEARLGPRWTSLALGSREGGEACSQGSSAPEGPQGYALHRPSSEATPSWLVSSFPGLANVVHLSLL